MDEWLRSWKRKTLSGMLQAVTGILIVAGVLFLAGCEHHGALCATVNSDANFVTIFSLHLANIRAALFFFSKMQLGDKSSDIFFCCSCGIFGRDCICLSLLRPCFCHTQPNRARCNDKRIARYKLGNDVS